jgi:hypothetical protein
LGKLRTYGVNDIAANDALLAIAGLDQREARGYLERLGLTPAAIDDMLSSTRCSPPPSYLVLSSSMIDMPSVLRMGNWDLRRALASQWVMRGIDAPDDSSLTILDTKPDAARKIFNTAKALNGSSAIENFIAPTTGYLSEGWLPCLGTDGGVRWKISGT